MAEVKQRFGRGAYNFALKIRSRYLLESRGTQTITVIRASSLLPGFLLNDIQNRELFGALKAAERVTDGVSPVFGNVSHAWGKGKNFYVGPKNCPLSNKTQVQNIEGNIPQYWSNGSFRRTFCTVRTAPRQSLYRRRTCCKYGQFVFDRAYSGNGTHSEPLYKTKTGYYDILQVTSNATQSQIKTAYYKQSFVYHPDRNAGSDEATIRFSEISEAYTVLGNKALRKKYDRGLLSQSDLTATARPSSARDTTRSTAKPQTGSRQSVMDADIRRRVFDFDKFFKEHYGEQLQRQKEMKDRREEMLKKKHESIGDKKLGRLSEMGIFVMLMMAVALLISAKRG